MFFGFLVFGVDVDIDVAGWLRDGLGIAAEKKDDTVFACFQYVFNENSKLRIGDKDLGEFVMFGEVYVVFG